MRMGDYDTSRIDVGGGGYRGDEAVLLIIAEEDEVDLDADQSLGNVTAQRLEDDDIDLQWAMDASRRIVTGGTPHAMVDADGRGDVVAGVAQTEPRCRDFYASCGHSDCGVGCEGS